MVKSQLTAFDREGQLSSFPERANFSNAKFVQEIALKRLHARSVNFLQGRFSGQPSREATFLIRNVNRSRQVSPGSPLTVSHWAFCLSFSNLANSLRSWKRNTKRAVSTRLSLKRRINHPCRC